MRVNCCLHLCANILLLATLLQISCFVEKATFSSPVAENCDALGDEDSNGLKDCADPVCSTLASCIAICGNETVDSGEQCDDGQALFGDGCDVECRLSDLHYLKPFNVDSFDAFGYDIAISPDGLVFASGAVEEDSNSASTPSDNSSDSAGAAYIFTRTNSTPWAHSAYLKATVTGPYDLFGWALSLSSDGRVIAVGAPGESSRSSGVNGNPQDDSLPNAGAVYVFERSPTGWRQTAYIKASNPDADDYFGHAVALSGDGSTLAVSAHREDSAARGVNGPQTDNLSIDSGAVYIFHRAGASWMQQAYIKAPNSDPSDQFGFSVSLTHDGSLLAAGAHREASAETGVSGGGADNTAPGSGAVYLYSRSDSTWTIKSYIKASNAQALDLFGSCVSLAQSGSLLTVGAPSEDSGARGINGNESDNSLSAAGAAYIFRPIGSTWQQAAYVKASNARAGDGFGFDCAAAESHFAVSARGEDSNAVSLNGDELNSSANDSGAVYVFGAVGQSWERQAYVKALNTELEDGFGHRVALSRNGSWLGVSALGEDSARTGPYSPPDNNLAPNAGAAYLYH